MSPTNKTPYESTVVMDAETMAQHLKRITTEIIENNADLDQLVLLGILRRGKPLADRIAQQIGALTGVTPPVGSIATTLYRDDIGQGKGSKKPRGTTHFDFGIDERTVLLVDDVLAAGRTIRAAMDEVMDYGRPARIQLACLVDRGGRELPIRADYLGWTIGAKENEWVAVRFEDADGEDVVLLQRYATQAEA